MTTIAEWAEMGVATVKHPRPAGCGVTLWPEPIFDCQECGAPATWLRYYYDNEADREAGEFRSCAWFCHECKDAEEVTL